MADLLMIDSCHSDIMFDDKPDNQLIHYIYIEELSNDVGYDPL
jgi:hypothetical protein